MICFSSGLPCAEATMAAGKIRVSARTSTLKDMQDSSRASERGGRTRALRDEPVPHPNYGHKMPRYVGIGFQLLPQLEYVSVHSAKIGKDFISPNGIQDQVTRKGLVDVLQKIAQEVVLDRRDVELAAAVANDAALEIHLV